jgi:hypothetical protein
MFTSRASRNLVRNINIPKYAGTGNVCHVLILFIIVIRVREVVESLSGPLQLQSPPQKSPQSWQVGSKRAKRYQGLRRVNAAKCILQRAGGEHRACQQQSIGLETPARRDASEYAL